MSDFQNEARKLGPQIKEVVDRVRKEIATEKTRQRAEAEAIALPYLQQIIPNVEKAARKEMLHAEVMALEGNCALLPGHEEHWRGVSSPEYHGWDLQLTGAAPYIPYAVLVVMHTLKNAGLQASIAGPKGLPRLILVLPSTP